MNATHALLLAGATVPFLYFGTQAAALVVNPYFNVLAQQPSELGCCHANLSQIANFGFILTGAAAMLGGIGLVSGLRASGAHILLAFLAGACMLLFGVAMTMSGVFPLPDPRHYGFGLYPAALGAPLFGAIAVKGSMRWIMAACLAATVAIVAVASGVGGVANAGNAGIFSRLASLVLFPAFAVLCWTAMRRQVTELA